MESILNKMIEILLDKNEEEGARHDAAMDLSEFNSEEVLKALQKVAQDPEEENIISSSCGESLGQILVKRKNLQWEFFKLIIPLAYREAYAVIKHQRPEWIEELLRDND